MSDLVGNPEHRFSHNEAHLYCFYIVTVSEKACPVIYRLSLSHICTNDRNSTALSGLKCLFFVILYLCLPVYGFDAIIMLGSFFLQIFKSTPCNQSCKRLGFSVFILTFTSILCFMCLHIVAVKTIVKLTFSHLITCCK